ncbi:uncharacterized protein LOC122029654 [Zingiber officinale]|uniref:uncharacterized protein LOC122029654 n=1 Tax=Zingiber officinale TaxID=94328 RepID=UPI001C4DCE5C|nr:uncharacterized protein LOC122029654 [Zingiber officinale]
MSAGGARGKGEGQAAAAIPSGSRKLVQSLKEIVNCSEAEIYAMLRECNMDPNEAVHRLLSQDTFHEVKSKRDKKKEIREPPESRSRTVSTNSGRGSKGGSDRGGRGTSSHSSFTDYGTGKGKPINKKENGGSVAPVLSVVESATVPNIPTKRPTVQSTSASMGNTMHATNFVDAIPTPMQSSSGFQNNWLGKPGHVSMADVVKMGRPQGKHPSMPVIASEKLYLSQNAAMLNGSHQNEKQIPVSILPSESKERLDSFQESTHLEDINHGLGTAGDQHISNDGWSIHDEQPTDTVSISTEITGTSAAYVNPSLAAPGVVNSGSDLHIDSCLQNFQDPDERSNDKPQPIESIPVAERKEDAETSIDGSHSKRIDAYQSEDFEYDHHEAEDGAGISQTAATLIQLSIHEETSTKTTEASPAVIIPDHLRVTNADCAHLSFGSFGSGAFSGSFPSNPLARNLEVAPAIDDASKIDESDARNLEYYNNGPHKSTVTENVASISKTASENLDVTSISEPEVVRNHPLDVTHGLQNEFSSVSSYGLPTSSQPNAATYTYLQGNSHMQNISPLSNLVQPNALQNNILAAASNPHLRDFDLHLSPLLINQSLPTNYGAMVSSIGGPTNSMPETMKPGMFSNPQSAPPSLPATTVLPSPALPQGLPVHHYSQPALPLGHFANMISYPILPPSYAYLPSLQQTLSPNSLFNQSSAVPSAGIEYSQPQYKGSLSVTSLPQASALPSAYGGFGSSSSIPGGFNLNHTTMASSTSIGFNEALNQQYKEVSHYLALQQNENPPTMWIHGAGSRTMSPLSSSRFYNYQGQNQHSGFRQAQPPSQLSGLGYSNLYLSQGGPSREHQPNPAEVNLNGPQTTQSQPSSQIWQHGY